MHRHPLALATAVAAFTLALGTRAQEASQLLTRQALTPQSWMIPIHTRHLDPASGEYGWWAAGPDYKVSFHYGFAFYPYLGPDYPENLPLRWQTTSVTAGGMELLLAGEAPRHHHADLRYEYRYANVVEAYDVTKQGAEQTFTIRERPASPGPIVVRGDHDQAAGGADARAARRTPVRGRGRQGPRALWRGLCHRCTRSEEQRADPRSTASTSSSRSRPSTCRPRRFRSPSIR